MYKLCAIIIIAFTDGFFAWQIEQALSSWRTLVMNKRRGTQDALRKKK